MILRKVRKARSYIRKCDRRDDLGIIEHIIAAENIRQKFVGDLLGAVERADARRIKDALGAFEILFIKVLPAEALKLRKNFAVNLVGMIGVSRNFCALRSRTKRRN